MNKIELVQTFISLLTAIAVSDMLISLHKLIRIRQLVKWHWIPLTWTFIVFIIIVQTWFSVQYRVNDFLLNYEAGFILFLVPMLLLLLMSMAVLPDNPKKSGINLLKWYFENKNYFYIVFILLSLSIVLLNIIEMTHRNISIFSPKFLPIGIPILISIILIYSKKNWVHTLLTILFLILAILISASHSLPE